MVAPTVLCIHDDPAITTAVRFRLRCSGVRLRVATVGSDGCLQANRCRPDVIITDLSMPCGTAGKDKYVVEQLKGHDETSGIPIIALTASQDHEVVRWMLKLGVDTYLVKPLDIERLVDRLKQFIAVSTRG